MIQVHKTLDFRITSEIPKKMQDLNKEEKNVREKGVVDHLNDI